MRKIGSHGARHIPVVSSPMRKCFFISEEICIALHRNPKAFGQNIIPRSWRFLRSVDVKLISFIAYSLSKIGVRLKPHVRIGYFVNGVQFIVPNRYMGIAVLPLKDFHQFHFDRIAASITNRTFRTRSYDEVVVILGSTLLNSAYNILSNVTGKPFIDSGDFAPKTLKLIDAHRPNL